MYFILTLAFNKVFFPNGLVHEQTVAELQSFSDMYDIYEKSFLVYIYKKEVLLLKL